MWLQFEHKWTDNMSH